MACLILSIAAISGCKFTQIKISQISIVKYGLFNYHDPNEDECRSIYDDDDYDKMLTSQYKVAQAIAIITILMLTSSIICVSILLYRPFSPCIMKLNQFLLVIVLAANITVAVLMIQKSTVKMFDDFCDLDYNLFQQKICESYPAFCNFGSRKLASSFSCKFTLLVGGGLNWCTSVLLIITFIISLIFGCNEVSESDNIEASEKVDDKIYQEEKPEIHVEKEERSII